MADWDRVSEFLRPTSWLGASLGVFILSIVTLPVVIPATGVILADGRRRRFGMWLIGVVVFLLLATCPLLFFAAMNSSSRITVAEALIAGMTPLVMLSGFIVTFAGSLVVCRFCGVRMS